MKPKLLDRLNRLQSPLNVLVAVIIGFVIGTGLMLIEGHDIGEAYAALFNGAFSGRFNFGGTLERFVPLLLSGLAFAISSKAAVFNVGVEGQLYFGAMTAAYFGYIITGLPRFLHIPLILVLAGIAGAIWAFIPGFLRAAYRVNEVCSTIMLNYVAIYCTGYIVNHVFKNPNIGVPQTPNIQESARLARILMPSRANSGVFIALGLVVFFIWLMDYTTLGYKIKTVGLNPQFATYAGFQARSIMVGAMALSGMIGGIMGAIQVLGIHGYFLDNFSKSLGFDGIMVALLARNNLKALPFVAFFLAALKSGAVGMERFTGIPRELIGIMEAVIILFAAAEAIIVIRRRISYGKGGAEVV